MDGKHLLTTVLLVASDNSDEDDNLSNVSSDDEADSPENLLHQLTSLLEESNDGAFEKIKSVNHHIQRRYATWSDLQMNQHLGIRKRLFFSLSLEYKNSPYFESVPIHRQPALTAESQFFITLWFVGQKHRTYRKVAKTFGIKASNVYTTLKRTCAFLCSMYEDVIQWSDEREKYMSKKRFFYYTGLNGVVGYVCSTYIKLDPCHRYKKISNEIKQIPLQIVFNTFNKIIHTYIGTMGLKEGEMLFRKSGLEQQISTLEKEEHLIADVSYPCLENLLTPFEGCDLDISQSAYNHKIEKGLKESEFNLRLLKMKFSQLNHLTSTNFDLQRMVVRACLVLYNITSAGADRDDPDKVFINKNYVSSPEALSLGEAKRLFIAGSLQSS